MVIRLHSPIIMSSSIRISFSFMPQELIRSARILRAIFTITPIVYMVLSADIAFAVPRPSSVPRRSMTLPTVGKGSTSGIHRPSSHMLLLLLRLVLRLKMIGMLPLPLRLGLRLEVPMRLLWLLLHVLGRKRWRRRRQ